jgi:hypothetical protein
MASTARAREPRLRAATVVIRADLLDPEALVKSAPRNRDVIGTLAKYVTTA